MLPEEDGGNNEAYPREGKAAQQGEVITGSRLDEKERILALRENMLLLEMSIEERRHEQKMEAQESERRTLAQKIKLRLFH